MRVTVLIYLSHSSNYLYNSSVESIKVGFAVVFRAFRIKNYYRIFFLVLFRQDKRITSAIRLLSRELGDRSRFWLKLAYFAINWLLHLCSWHFG